MLVTDPNSRFFKEEGTLIKQAAHYESLHLVDDFEHLSLSALTAEYYDVVVGEGLDPRGSGILMTLHGTPYKFASSNLLLRKLAICQLVFGNE